MKRSLSHILTLFSIFSLLSCGTSKKNQLADEKKDTTTIQVNKNIENNFPKSIGWVNDFDSILTDNEENQLNNICSNYEKTSTNQLVIATIHSFKPYNNIADYSKDLFNEWKIGTKEKNNGVLIVLCKGRHEVRIETGLGVEKILTNKVCDHIIDPIMLSYFEEEKYYEGLKAGTEEIIKKWK